MRHRRVELRVSSRRPMRYAGWITTSNWSERVPCVVWDLSDGGARLGAAKHHDLPVQFTLFLAKFGGERRCQVVWRDQRFVGVKFLY